MVTLRLEIFTKYCKHTIKEKEMYWEMTEVIDLAIMNSADSSCNFDSVTSRMHLIVHSVTIVKKISHIVINCSTVY